MTNCFKIKRYWILTLCMLFCSMTTVFAQERTDQEIGLNVDRITTSLKAHGVAEKDLNREINRMRKAYSTQYATMKKNEDAILQKIRSKQSNKEDTAVTSRTAITVDIPPAERAVLVAFYNSTNGDNWMDKTGWDINNLNSDVATWYGVSVNNGHVVGLSFYNNALSGSIPDLSVLTSLAVLDLSANNFNTESVPLWIDKLFNLQVLDLSGCYFSGPIPDLSLLTKLTNLSLAANNFTGASIPTWINKLINLQILYLYDCSFSGSIPDLSSLKSLTHFSLMGNNFTVSSIPSWINNFTNLQVLYLYNCSFSGSIPNLSSLKSLTNLGLGGNNFTGTSIPSWINDFVNLDQLELYSCHFNGAIPDLSALTNLSVLYISDNDFDNASMPLWIDKLTKLRQLDLQNSNFKGPMIDLSALTSLSYLSLGGNNFDQNKMPSWIFNLSGLIDLSLNNCNLNGSIPADIGRLSNLQSLLIFDNQLEGGIPSEISTLTNLQTIWLHNNKFRFVDFGSQYPLYKTQFSSFEYSPQSKIDIEKTITTKTGDSVTLTMCEDDRFIQNIDTFQWYKNGQEIIDATSREYTISNFTASNAGDYYCISNNSEIPDLILERNPIHLSGINCIPKTGKIEGDSDKFCTKEISAFLFKEAITQTKELANDNLSTEKIPESNFNWTCMDSNGVVINTVSNNTGLYNFQFDLPGNYVIKLEYPAWSDCKATFSKNITVESCVTEKHCVSEGITFAFETTATNLNYVWSSINSFGEVVNTVSNTTGLYTFTPDVPGNYVIELVAIGTDKCETIFSENVIVEDCIPFLSCTKTNVNSPEIKKIFTNLVNKLLSLPQGTVIDGYKCPELTALVPYITDEKPAIYKFINDINYNYVSFSFDEHDDNDVKMATDGSIVADFNLDKYESPETLTQLRKPSEDHIDFVKHIDFCAELSCLSHIALVVDESGSIDKTEADKIKKQLKKFVQQQADTNDNLKTNIYISLTGMSDGDINMRTDNIRAVKITNDPAVLKKFNTWIDKFGSSNGQPGISAGSDYWKSGLDVALESDMKPDIVLMITDGCQTADVTGLKETMARFNNFKSKLDISPDKPHLYVVGIENGFYVDSDALLGAKMASRNEDPNYIPSLQKSSTTSRVTLLLRKSLQFLLDYPGTEFPVASIDDFGKADYFGHDNFDLLASDETYFSDKLAVSHIVCGEATVKDFCSDCFSFQPEPGKEYMLSAWVKEESSIQVKTYENPGISLVFYNDKKTEDLYIISTLTLKATGDIIDGWQRIVSKFTIPANTVTVAIELENKSIGIPVYFDDIRIHPLQGSMKTFVYDPETFKLMSELDENNYSTFYEYDNEGGLVRVKKETAKGVKTIQETRSGSVINTKD